MKIVFAILSDIHFEVGKGHPILARSEQIASAISSSDADAHTVFLVLPGDIADGGLPEEFSIAESFLKQIRERLKQRLPHVDIKVVSTPGNHDCYLPKEAVAHRKARVESSVATVVGHDPDELFLADLLEVQNAYWRFASRSTDAHPTSTLERVCCSIDFPVGEKLIQLNLINSALLSQRYESKAGLYLPVELINQRLSLGTDKALAISLVHHPEFWIEPTNMTSFRRVLNRISDLVITGHEHLNNSFTRHQDTGELLSFYESPALFDSKRPTSSAFRVLVVDLTDERQKELHYRWDSGIYRQKGSNDDLNWKPLVINRQPRHAFELSTEHIRLLSEVGVAYVHPNSAHISLRELFVYPDLRIEGAGDKSLSSIKGTAAAAFLSACGILILEGGAFSGKTAFSKQLCYDLSTKQGKVPILIQGQVLVNLSVEHFQRELVREFRHQYRDADSDMYLQLDIKQRVVIVDNWHLSRLTSLQRDAILVYLEKFACSSILLVDDLYKIKQLISRKDPAAPKLAPITIKNGEILGLSYVSRGKLIHNWYRLRKSPQHEMPETSNTAKSSEDFISRLLGKDNLPPYAFFVLCMLQAQESNKVDSVAGGSFGHYHQVLVTTTLTKGLSQKTQLDRKVAFCSELAYFMWKNKRDVVSREEIDKIVAAYLDRHLLALQPEPLLFDLEDARVLSKSEEHFSFTYPQFFYYFVARYIKENFDSEIAIPLREGVNEMVDNISSNENSSIIMFLIFFASDRKHIIERLLSNAAAIYSDITPANLSDDATRFLGQRDLLPAPPVEIETDVAENRLEQRERQDAVVEGESQNGVSAFEAYCYSEDLSDQKKMHLAEKNIEALGQVIRNFSTTLPAKLKVEVLQATYNLALRTMARLLAQVAELMDAATDKLKEDQPWHLAESSMSVNDLQREMNKYLFVMGKLISIHYCKKISSSVGVSDNELAYQRALESMEPTTAIRLVNITILMEHSGAFPEARVKALFEELRSNSFALGVLQFLVSIHLLVYKVDPETRRRMSKLIGVDPKRLETAALELRNQL